MTTFNDRLGENRIEIDKEVESITSSKLKLGGTTGSFDTREIDPFRQGVNIRSYVDRFAGFQVKVSEGSEDHSISTRQYGQPKLFRDDTAFDDLPEFSRPSIIDKVAFGGPVAFIEAGDSRIDLYPQIRFNGSMLDPATMDGVVEIFQLREIITNTSTEAPYYARCIRASMAGADDNRVFGSSQITNKKFDMTRRPEAAGDSLIKGAPASGYFEDGQDYMFRLGNVSLPLPGLIAEDARKSRPFNDISSVIENSKGSDLILDQDFAVVSRSIRIKTDSEDENVFYSCGRDYYNENNITFSNGTDSIAFGGLVR